MEYKPYEPSKRDYLKHFISTASRSTADNWTGLFLFSALDAISSISFDLYPASPSVGRPQSAVHLSIADTSIAHPSSHPRGVFPETMPPASAYFPKIGRYFPGDFRIMSIFARCPAGARIPHSTPWGTARIAPSSPASECTTPNPALASAAPEQYAA